MIGTTIAQYKILEKLGEGGMGVVYKAEDTKLKRTVALKFLPPGLSSSEQDKARFVLEAQAASALNHPNVCTIHDIQEYEGQMFIVMEFVDGQTLREKKDKISFKQALDIGVQIAEGLAAAHEKGIVHRDIKPDNIMIRKDGIAQIMDFGLAKLRATGSKITRLTKEGSTVGTAGYMSPEQVQGQETDHRSDIFSYGVLLYELLTGQLPFKGMHETAMMYEIVNVEAPPMSSVKPDIDPVLDAIVLECLEKDPNERTQSIKQVSIDLKRFKRETTRQRVTRIMPVQQIAKSGTEPDVPVSGKRRSVGRWIWQLISGLLLLGMIFALVNPWQKNQSIQRPPLHLTVDLPPNANHTGGSDAIAISPDGKYIVYTGGVLSNPRLYLRNMDQLTVQLIPGTEGGDEPVFSPDGQWIAFVVGDKMKKVSIFGGTAVEICETQGLSRGLWWGTEGYIYYGHISRGVQRVSANGGHPEAVTSLDSTAGEISHRFPQVLPDGRSVIFTIKPNNITSFDDAIIAVQRIGEKEKKILVRGGTFARYVPTGHLVYVRGSFLYAMPFDINKLEVTGLPVQIAEGGWMNTASGQSEFSFSNTGAMIYSPAGAVAYNSFRLGWMDREGKTSSLIDSLRNYGGAAISPDGQKIAIGISAANDDIWVYQLSRGTLTRLTFGGGNNNLPLWSPDGRYIFYTSEKGSSQNIYRKAWDGSGNEERLTTSPNAQIPASISPDGSTLAYTESGNIWMLPLANDRNPWQFTNSPASEINPVFSPDGKWIAYSSNESGNFEVYIVPYPKPEGKWQISSEGGVTPYWSSNGKRLYYFNGNSIMMVDITTETAPSFSTPKKICDLPSSIAGVYDMTKDEQRFVVSLASAGQYTLDHLNIVIEWFTELKDKFSSNKN